MMHGGVLETLAHLRTRFFLFQERDTIKKAILRSLVCRKHNARTVCQATPVLTQERVTQALQLQGSGIDFTGPFDKADNSHSTKYTLVALPDSYDFIGIFPDSPVLFKDLFYFSQYFLLHFFPLLKINRATA